MDPSFPDSGCPVESPGNIADRGCSPILLSVPVMMDLGMGHVTPELFDRVFDQAQPGDWKDVEALAKKSGLTAQEVLEMIRNLNVR